MGESFRMNKILLLASADGSGLIQGLLFLIVIGFILGVVLYFLPKTPMPEMFVTVITWVIYLVAFIILINFLLGLIGYGLWTWPRIGS